MAAGEAQANTAEEAPAKGKKGAETKKIERMKILKCTCKSEFQDKQHGVGMRVHTGGIKKSPPFKCTVCKSRRF